MKSNLGKIFQLLMVTFIHLFKPSHQNLCPRSSGGWLPYFGHGILLVKQPGGRKRPWKNFAKLKEQYVPQGRHPFVSFLDPTF
jgi:hypothetical protein